MDIANASTEELYEALLTRLESKQQPVALVPLAGERPLQRALDRLLESQVSYDNYKLIRNQGEVR